MGFFRRFLPTPESLRNNRWLRWLGPALLNPRLWRVRRRSLALGMALGFFFGLLVPLAQIPLSAAAAVALRANVPAAVASTLVTNPLTFGPLYYAAWRIGHTILDGPSAPAAHPQGAPATEDVAASNAAAPPDEGFWAGVERRVKAVGKPLLLGLAIMASVVGVLTYVGVSLAWRIAVLRKRRARLRRLRERRERAAREVY